VPAGRNPALSYKKPDNRSAVQASVAGATGAAVLQKGKIKSKPIVKLALVIDQSGSMEEILPRVLGETFRLVKDLYDQEDNSELLLIATYANSVEYFASNPNTDKVWKVPDFSPNSVSKRNNSTSIKLKDFFRTGVSGITNVDQALYNNMISLLSRGYNVLWLSDFAMTREPELSYIKNLMRANASSMFLIVDNEFTFKSLVDAAGINYPNWTYFK